MHSRSGKSSHKLSQTTLRSRARTAPPITVAPTSALKVTDLRARPPPCLPSEPLNRRTSLSAPCQTSRPTASKTSRRNRSTPAEDRVTHPRGLPNAACRAATFRSSSDASSSKRLCQPGVETLPSRSVLFILIISSLRYHDEEQLAALITPVVSPPPDAGGRASTSAPGDT